MQVLDRTGVGTLWSICKAKFALAGHTHSSITDGTMTVYSMQNNEVNFGGSNNSATIHFGYRAKDSKPIPSNFIFGGSTGTATLTAAKFKGALEGNASTASNASKVNGHTVNADVPSGAKFTDTNTWRGIQDNLTSTSTSESLSANQGKVLKGLVDGKANSSHTHTLGQITNAGAAASKNVRTLSSVSHSSWSSASTDDLYVPTMSFIAYWNGAYNSSGNSNLQYCYKGKFGNLAVKDTADWSQVASKPATATRWPSWGEVTGKPELKSWSETKSYIDSKVDSENNYPTYSLQSYIQSQLKRFGLTCRTYPCNNVNQAVGAKCGILAFGDSDEIYKLFHNNSYIQNGFIKNTIDTKMCKELSFGYYGKDIYCIWNNYVVTMEVNGSPNTGYSVDVCFLDPFKNTTKKITVVTNDTTENIKRAVACTYDNLYVSCNRSFCVFDKSLNFKKYSDFLPENVAEIKYLYNYGDLGIFIIPYYGDIWYYYKNGTISKYTESASSLQYTKNGHKYNLGSNNYQLITDDLAIKFTGKNNTIALNTVQRTLFYIVDLQKNIEIPVTIPVELFGVMMIESSNFTTTGIPLVKMDKYSQSDGELRYYILVYKE